jgi:hypothetical protein
MTSEEFSKIRKELNKTQKEIASLLNLSLKAICSYEQGWRAVPNHVERQLLFLLARKKGFHQYDRNCWELHNCPEQTRTQCPAWEFDSGKFCWFLGGTLCHAGQSDNKFEDCKRCEMMRDIT